MQGTIGDGYGPKYRTQSLGALYGVKGNCFAIGRPGSSGKEVKVGTRSQDVFLGAVGIGDQNINAFVVLSYPQKSKLSTVRRIAAGAVDSLLHNESRSSTECRHPIEIGVKGVIFLRAHIIHVVAIRCESQTPNHNFIWGQNLYVAAGGQLANVEALFFPFSQRVDHIAPVWRNHNIGGIAALRNAADLHGLQVPFTPSSAPPEQINPKGNHQERKPNKY